MNPDQLNIIKRCVVWTWDAIAYDVVANAAEFGEEVGIDDMVEMVLDANRLESYTTGKLRKAANSAEYSDAVKAFRALPPEQQKKIAREALQ